MLRCAASLVTAAYATPLELFTRSSKSLSFETYYEFISNDIKKRFLFVAL